MCMIPLYANQQLRSEMHIRKDQLTQAQLHQCLAYNASTGHLIWKQKIASKVVVGQRAGSVSKRDNRRVIKLFGELYLEHRLIWFYTYGNWPVGHIDHINHDEQDNPIENIRDVTQIENNMNSSKRKDNSTGYTGVWINKLNSRKKYMAELNLHGQRLHYSSHYTLEEAIQARKKAEKDFGFHPNHGMEKPLESSTTIP